MPYDNHKMAPLYYIMFLESFLFCFVKLSLYIYIKATHADADDVSEGYGVPQYREIVMTEHSLDPQ